MNVLLVVRVRMYREGLVEALGHSRGIQSVICAEDGVTALDASRVRAPDVALVDMSLAENLRIIRSLVAARPDLHVVALAVQETESQVLACVEAGAAAYVSRDASLADLVETIHRAQRGEALCSPRIVGVMVRRLAMLAQDRGDCRTEDALTTREHDILTLIGDGLSNREISDRLCIQLSTVKNHVHNILCKLGVTGRAEAVAAAAGVLAPRI